MTADITHLEICKYAAVGLDCSCHADSPGFGRAQWLPEVSRRRGPLPEFGPASEKLMLVSG